MVKLEQNHLSANNFQVIRHRRRRRRRRCCRRCRRRRRRRATSRRVAVGVTGCHSPLVSEP